jgi:hypothetical protein
MDLSHNQVLESSLPPGDPGGGAGPLWSRHSSYGTVPIAAPDTQNEIVAVTVFV